MLAVGRQYTEQASGAHRTMEYDPCAAVEPPVAEPRTMRAQRKTPRRPTEEELLTAWEWVVGTLAVLFASAPFLAFILAYIFGARL